MTDLYYQSDGFLVSLFPNTEEGETVFREICQHFELGTFPVYMLPNIKQQLTDAGYSVRKRRKGRKMTGKEARHLLSQLGL